MPRCVLGYIIFVFSVWNRAKLAHWAAPESVKKHEGIRGFGSVWNWVYLIPILRTNRKSGLMLHKLNLQAWRHQFQVTWDISWFAYTAGANEQSHGSKIFILAACYQSGSYLSRPVNLFTLSSWHSSLVWKASGSQVDFLMDHLLYIYYIYLPFILWELLALQFLNEIAYKQYVPW